MTAPNRRTHRRAWTEDSGSSTIEFAIIAPVLLLFLFGIFEFGRFFWTQNLLQYAVEQTARHSLRSVPEITDCTTSVANSAVVTANLVGLTASTATVTLLSATNGGTSLTTPPTPAPKSCTITITYPFSFFGFLNLPSFNATGVAAFPCGTGTTCA